MEQILHLQSLLDHKQFLELRNELAHLPEIDIAEFIDELDDDKNVIIVFRLLPKEKAAEIFSNLSAEHQASICNLIGDEELRDIINDLFFDDMIDLLEEMPANIVKRIVKQRGEKERALINQFLNYKENSAGSLMTIEFVDLHRDMTISEAMMRIRRDAEDKETVYNCYVMDNARRLDGIVSLKNIILAEEHQLVEDIMDEEDLHFVTTDEDQEVVAEIFRRYDLLALPVVDKEKRLVGIVTVDDIMDVMEEESTEDILKMGAVAPYTEPYFEQSTFTLAKKRVPWLLILMISSIFSSMIIRHFEDTLAAYVALTAFIPMLMDTGGNAGSQTSTTVIRALTLGELTIRDIIRVIWKEVRVAVLVAMVLCAFTMIRVAVFEGYSFGVASVISITLFFTIVTAKALGGALPILAKTLKLDPALMASPMITTIVDAISLVIYFQFAGIILGIA